MLEVEVEEVGGGRDVVELAEHGHDLAAVERGVVDDVEEDFPAGAGEGGTISAIGAIINAVENALSPFGVTIAEAPISPQRIVELLGKHARGRTQ